MVARCPLDAWRAGQKAKATGMVDVTCDKYALMEQLFRAKLAQYPDISLVLIATEERLLLKVHSDSDWGTGEDGRGENRMGKLWMKLRAELQNKV